jgi:hypothetical protein
MLSLRVSVQRVGLASSCASQATRISSVRPLADKTFDPNPPPTSGATTRTCAASMPSMPAIASRSWCGVCVLSQIVSLPSSNAAAVDRGSSGHGAIRWLTSVPETVTSQPSKRSSACAAGGWVRAATFVPAPG